jgi:hypothetical protein
MDNVLTSSEQEIFKPYVVEVFEQGMEKGMEKILLSFISKNMEWPDEKIANLFDVPIDLVKSVGKVAAKNLDA